MAPGRGGMQGLTPKGCNAMQSIFENVMQCDTIARPMARKTLQTSFRFTQSDWAVIDSLREKTGLSPSSVVRLALRTLQEHMAVPCPAAAPCRKRSAAARKAPGESHARSELR